MSEDKNVVPEENETPLSEESLEQVSGGYIFLNEDGEWAIIDANGNEIALIDEDDEEAAIAEAARRGVETREIEWWELRKLRGIPVHK